MPSLQESLAAFIAALVALFQATCDPALPPLAASRPAAGAADVARTAWIELDFSAPVPAFVPFRLSCDGGATFRPLTMHHVTPENVVLNPEGQLPAGATCSVGWRTAGGPAALAFATAPAGAAVRVVHDRTNLALTGPIPDDFYLTSDPSTVTGNRLNYPIPARNAEVQSVFAAVLAEANQIDGWSPVAHAMVEATAPLDATTLPRTPAEALSPLSTVALLDVDPASPTFGERIPFKLEVRSDTTPQLVTSHTFLVFPGIPLEPEGKYGLVVTRRVLTSPGRPLDPSTFFAAALAAAAPGESAAIERTRTLAQEVLAVAGSSALAVPIPADDVAYAARISIRSTDAIQDDVQVMKRQILSEPPPALTIDLANPQSVVNDPNPFIEAYVRGVWDAPDWRGGTQFFVRDAAGRPVRTGSRPVCFRLTLPTAALSGPVPIVMHQHGNPGEAEVEVRSNSVNFLAQAGYAVIGFTDILNRVVAPPAAASPLCVSYETPTADATARITTQVFSIVGTLLGTQKISDHWNQTLGEQLAFVRAIQGLEDLDLLPLGAPDGVPDLDTTRILYHGISEGGNNGQAFVPYAPEVDAAALMVGGARLMEVLIHQQAATFVQQLPALFPGMTAADVWAATSFFQSDFDRQDKHNHGRFAFRERALVPLFCDDLASCLDADWCDDPTHCTDRKPSTLLVEGVNDLLVPNSTTESAAWQYGPIPHLGPVQRAVPFLDVVTGPVVANVDAETTAAFYQYVPTNVPNIPATPSCLLPAVINPTNARNGHYCAQSAIESRAQRLIFFGTAVDPARAAPTIVDPLPYYPPGSTSPFPLPNPLP
jgi:hypothetical protein